MKTVFIISTMRFHRNNTAGVNRTIKYGKMLSEKSIRVIFASLLEYDRDAELNQIEDNTDVFISPSKKNNPISFKRQIKFILPFLRDLVKLNGNRNDSVFLLYPSTYVLFDFIVLLYIKFWKRIPLFYEGNEVRKYTIYNKTIFGLLKTLLYSINEQLLYFYDGIICISRNIEGYYSKYNKNTINIPILVDSVDVEYFTPTFFKNNDIFKIGFSGTVDIEKENLECFLKSLEFLIKEKYKVEFHIYGKITEEEHQKLIKLGASFGISSIIHYKGIIDQKMLINALREFQLLVLPRDSNNQNKYGFSTKLSDYMLTFVPILLTDVSDNLVYITDSINGFVANSKSPLSFAGKIKDIHDNYENYCKFIGQNAFISANKHFNYKLHSSNLEKFLHKV